MMMNDDGDVGDDDVWTSKKKPVLSSFLAHAQLYNHHLDGPPSSNAPLTCRSSTERKYQRHLWPSRSLAETSPSEEWQGRPPAWSFVGQEGQSPL